MKRCVSLFLIIIAVALSAAAQNPVRWRMSVKMTGPNTGEVTLRALVSDGWHMYGTTLPDGGPRPTVIDFGGSEGIAVTGAPTATPEPVRDIDPMFNMKLSWWNGNVSFVQRFKVTDAAKALIKCKVTYMCCDNNNCRPPRTETLTTPLPTAK